jgi:DNA-binding SARP family transcriptional activator
MVEFRILGPIEVGDGAHTLELGGLRERTLLACLVLSANHVISTSRLSDELWAGHPPPHSETTLRVYIARLRRALGTGAEALVTHRLGYQLKIASAELDANRFVAMADSARAELASARTPGSPARWATWARRRTPGPSTPPRMRCMRRRSAWRAGPATPCRWRAR